jgi:hypothetical protein
MSEAIATAENSKERWREPEIHRIAGEIELLSPGCDMTRADEHFQRGLEIARAEQTRSWELRTATSLARLKRNQERRQGPMTSSRPSTAGSPRASRRPT